MKKLILKVVIFLIIYSTSDIIGQTANPTRPSSSDNAYLTEYGFTELEIGYSGDKDRYSIPALLKFSVLKKLEAGILMSGIINYNGSKTQIGDPGIQLKYQFLNNQNIAAALAGKIGFSSSSSATYTFYVVPSI